jgi:hypothetical protein
MADLERWFKDRTFSHEQFSDIGALVRSKEEQGLKISVCLPTLNVGDTVGECVRVFRTELLERFPLIDQLCIIDSRSTDGTLAAARDEGAEIFFDDEILPGFKPEAGGKGEALWKSLFVLEGDIVVWVDSDIENIHPRFVYGLVGPLLADPDIGYVKAFYRRPLNEGGVLRPGGGRVTELTVRPMLNMFYPELSGLIQPLSGEYAGRRNVLAGVPFFTGYGVETGLLLDILAAFGAGAIAQTDVEVRVHHNQSLQSLSKMSFGIMQALFKRLADEGKLTLQMELSPVYNTVSLTDSGYSLEAADVKVVERPPAREVDEYGEDRRRGPR